jgi:polyphosphate kinase
MNCEADIAASLGQALKEAQDESRPLVHRLRVLASLGSSADRFLAKLTVGTDSPVEEKGAAPAVFPAKVEELRTEMVQFLSEAANCFHHSLNPALHRRGIHFRTFAELSVPQQQRANQFFCQAALPVLTPLGFDPGRPFPKISNFSVNLAVGLVDTQGRKRFARIKVPDGLPQFLRLDPMPQMAQGSAETSLLWLEDLIMANLGQLFPRITIMRAHPFRIIRGQPLAHKVTNDAPRANRQAKRLARVVLLQTERQMPDPMLQILTHNLKVHASAVYRGEGLLSLSRLSHLATSDLLAANDPPREKIVSLSHRAAHHSERELSA